MNNKIKHIHFIGICGVAMSALALAFKRQGCKVTGSDVGFYPPISTYLDEQGVEYYPGWHPEKMGTPDLVVVGNVASSSNPEWKYVQKNKLNYKSYPEVIKEFIIKPNSIVCAGTYGKSTTTALLTWIFKNNGFDPNYMFGGLMSETPTSPLPRLRGYPPQGGNLKSPLEGGEGDVMPLPSATITTSDWSIVEGDEYKTARWDKQPKFAYYAPKHLLLTAVTWDHADIYKTERKYEQAFQKLVDGLPDDGKIIVSERVDNIKLPKNTITYGKEKNTDYRYSDIKQNTNGLIFTITHAEKTYTIVTPCLGDYMADNITSCFALANELRIAPEKIIASIKTFIGMKRRLEKRLNGNITVIDDIAHSPVKAEAILQTLRQLYSGKILAVFEPNTGNRRPESISSYGNAFRDADEIIIPHLTQIKRDAKDTARPLEGDELAKIIGETHAHASYISDDDVLIDYVTKNAGTNSVIVFLGSHGFRGMIEKVVERLKI
jgi:UDP-N-acetylmuramate: L-alanyl-gamma-D-glutamyl-meso-diaminopimelate ligase